MFARVVCTVASLATGDSIHSLKLDQGPAAVSRSRMPARERQSRRLSLLERAVNPTTEHLSWTRSGTDPAKSGGSSWSIAASLHSFAVVVPRRSLQPGPPRGYHSLPGLKKTQALSAIPHALVVPPTQWGREVFTTRWGIYISCTARRIHFCRIVLRNKNKPEARRIFQNPAKTTLGVTFTFPTIRCEVALNDLSENTFGTIITYKRQVARVHVRRFGETSQHANE